MPSDHLDEEGEKQFQLWLADRPQVIRDMAKRMPPNTCYRQRDGNPMGHYTLYSYSEDGTVSLVHGADSFLPGVMVFGVREDACVRCDCGNWKPPSEEAARATRAYIDVVAKAHHAKHDSEN